MKRNLCHTIIACLMLCMQSCMSTHGYVKEASKLSAVKRIAVFPFVSKGEAIGYTIAELLTAELMASRFTIIERSQLEHLLAERNMTMEGIIAGRESFVGKLSGIDAVIMGSVIMSRGFAGLAYGGNIDYVSACTARIVDVQTGEILYAVSYKASAPTTWNGVSTAGKAAGKLASQLKDL